MKKIKTKREKKEKKYEEKQKHSKLHSWGGLYLKSVLVETVPKET